MNETTGTAKRLAEAAHWYEICAATLEIAEDDLVKAVVRRSRNVAALEGAKANLAIARKACEEESR